MAGKKTSSTSAAGLFGALEGDLSFDNLSGPKLFTPVPSVQPLGSTPNSILQHNTSVTLPATNATPSSFTPPPPETAPGEIGNIDYSVTPVQSVLSIPPSVSPPLQSPSAASYQRPMQVVSPQPKKSYDVSTVSTTEQNVTAINANPTTFNTQPLINSFVPSTPETTEPIPLLNTKVSTEQSNPIPATVKPHLPSLQPLTPHWFYYNGSYWIPFSYIDSGSLEGALQGGWQQPIRTDGGRYDVNLHTYQRQSVYWNDAPCEVRRCTWFFKSNESKLIPYDVSVASMLENEYVKMTSTGVYNIRVDVSPSTFVIFHNPNVLVQYASHSEHLDWTGEDAKVRPKLVQRGLGELREFIEQGEQDEVDHLIFVVHGIGPVADLKMRSIVECVDDFRKVSLDLTRTHRFQMNGKPASRVEFLPIQWYSCLRDDLHGIDHQLKTLSLPSIGKLRNFTNDTLTDILFYTSPVYCQTICNTIVNEINRLYQLFLSRNPTFNGSTSVVGHSLGSCILFDILANQVDNHVAMETDTYEDFGETVETVNPSPVAMDVLKEVTGVSSGVQLLPTVQELLTKLNLQKLETLFTEEQIDTETLLMCSETDLKDLGVPFGPRKKLSAYLKANFSDQSVGGACTTTSLAATSSARLTRGTQTRVQVQEEAMQETLRFAYRKGTAGTGQPLVEYAKLNFEPDTLYCLGSPLGLFMTCRGVSSIGLEYQLPKCSGFMNIFHPYDPVVYRLEPLVNELIDIPPVLIPHHKGRKRFHLEIKENLSRVGANLKSGLIDAVNRTWSSIHHFAKAHTSQENKEHKVDGATAAIEEEEDLKDEETLNKEKLLDFGCLNDGGRVDYVLQERPYEILNEYLFALSSHTCYWTSEDTSLLILDNIYNTSMAAT